MRPAVPVRRAAAVAALLLTCAAAGASGQVQLQGRVVERGTTAGLGGVSIEVSGAGRALTDSNGGFHFNGLAAGRYTLNVQGLGYRPVDLAVVLRADTSIVIELVPAPVALDTITAQARVMSIRGHVEDGATGREIIDAEVVAGERRASTNVAGDFRLNGLPQGQPARLSVRAFGYAPVDTVIPADTPERLRFRLRPDPIALQMIAAQVDRLDQRTLRSPFGREVIGRDELLLKMHSSTAYDVLIDHLGTFRLRRIVCVLIDDRERPYGVDELKSYLPDQIERMEWLTRHPDRSIMLRIYTRGYLQDLVAGGAKLTPLIFVERMCR